METEDIEVKKRSITENKLGSKKTSGKARHMAFNQRQVARYFQKQCQEHSGQAITTPALKDTLKQNIQTANQEDFKSARGKYAWGTAVMSC